MRWIAKPHSIVPLRRTFSWSLIGHTGLLAFLLVVSVLPAPRHRRMRVHASNTMTIRAFPTVSTRPEPKGEDRELEVENAVRPQEPPKATPAPVAKVTPAPRKVIERPTVKENVSMKKVLATPTPEIKKTPEPAPLKEVKAVATPEVKKSPPPATTSLASAAAASAASAAASDSAFENRPAPKGVKNGTDMPGSGQDSMAFDGDVVIPGDYVADAVQRLRLNFVYPKSVDTHLSAPVTCVVVFKIMNDGTIEDIEVEDPTANANLARFAIDAVAKTRFFLPLKEYTKNPYITARVPFTFGADLQEQR